MDASLRRRARASAITGHLDWRELERSGQLQAEVDRFKLASARAWIDPGFTNLVLLAVGLGAELVSVRIVVWRKLDIETFLPEFGGHQTHSTSEPAYPGHRVPIRERWPGLDSLHLIHERDRSGDYVAGLSALEAQAVANSIGVGISSRRGAEA